MFEKILLAVDESGPSERAIPAAAALAKRFHGEVVMLQVPEREPGVGTPAASSADASGWTASLADRIVMDLKDCGVSARPEIWSAPSGEPAQSIADAVRHEGVDLIVMGWASPEADGLPNEVLGLTHRPVLVVP